MYGKVTPIKVPLQRKRNKYIQMKYDTDTVKKYETDTLFVYKNCPSLRLLSIVHSDPLSRKYMNDKQTL